MLFSTLLWVILIFATSCCVSCPVMYLLLKIGLGYESCYYLFIIATIVYFWCILFILKKQVCQFNIKKFLTHAVAPLAISSFATYITCNYIETLIPNSLINLFLYIITCVTITATFAWSLSLSMREKNIIKQFLKSKLYHHNHPNKV